MSEHEVEVDKKVLQGAKREYLAQNTGFSYQRCFVIAGQASIVAMIVGIVAIYLFDQCNLELKRCRHVLKGRGQKIAIWDE